MTENQSRENSNYEDSAADEAYKRKLIGKSNENIQSTPNENSIERELGYDSSHASQSEIQKVAEKVGEVPTAVTSIVPLNSMLVLENTKIPHTLVRDLETRFIRRYKKRFSKRQLKILELAASIHIWEKRGITVDDLERVGYQKDNAEKIIHDAKRAGLFIPLQKRIGKHKQYSLSNYKFVLDKKGSQEKEKELSFNDAILILLKLLLDKRYKYHDFVIETSLNYPTEDYNHIVGEVLSEKNKQKTGIIPLSTTRSCSYTVSPNGTVMLFIECTLEPFDLHSYRGVVDFFVTCGQIYSFFQTETKRRANVIPNVDEWYLKEFEYNKDLVIEELEQNCPMVRWTATGLIKLEYLGHLFQIYQKPMPDIGNCLRVEGRQSEKADKNLVDQMEKIPIQKNSLFVTAEEMLKNHLKE